MRETVAAGETLSRFGELSFVLAALGHRFDVNTARSYDMDSLQPIRSFLHKGEEWGLTRDDRQLILSDGTSKLRFLDPDTFFVNETLRVADGGAPVVYLNELEFVGGEIFANVWYDDRIAIIDPNSGQVTGWVNLAGLKARLPVPSSDPDAVLNGIAYDVLGDRLFVTGKLWPLLFEIRLHRN
jgi:glutaminyl-peptide cyclotransferase